MHIFTCLVRSDARRTQTPVCVWNLKYLSWVVCGIFGNSVSLQGEIKLSVTIEDEANKDLPSAVQLFRPIRQYVYGVLFSLSEARKKAERLAMRRNCLPECESCV